MNQGTLARGQCGWMRLLSSRHAGVKTTVERFQDQALRRVVRLQPGKSRRDPAALSGAWSSAGRIIAEALQTAVQRQAALTEEALREFLGQGRDEDEDPARHLPATGAWRHHAPGPG